MVQPWERVARQRITQSFSPNPEIFFPPLGEDEETEGLMIIEGEYEATVYTTWQNSSIGEDWEMKNTPLGLDEFRGSALLVPMEWRWSADMKGRPLRYQTNNGRKSSMGAINRISDNNSIDCLLSELELPMANRAMERKNSRNLLIFFAATKRWQCIKGSGNKLYINGKISAGLSACSWFPVAGTDTHENPDEGVGVHLCSRLSLTQQKDAKYEALIAGLRITEQMGVKNLQANVDSRLVANQVNGTYVAKEADMIRYLEKVRTLTSSFKAFSIRQIPRSENKKADALSKIASTYFAHLSKQVLVEELEEKKNRFGLPGEIISDNGKQFRDNPFKYWCEKLCIHQHFASVKHPQTNGLVKRANRSLREGIKVRLDARSKNWIEELPHVLWAHRTKIKSSNGDTPFSLTYETEAVIPAEIGMPTLRTVEVDL
ncbi:reverse transcriptase domain-containing protein, partial [Tanacetum coccineum]